ncbi:MAG TPA: hypothetical protein VGK73_33725 [Polyangiaceae bacterium]
MGGGGDATSGGTSGGSEVGGAGGDSASGGAGTAGASNGGSDGEGGAPGDPLEPVRVIRGGPGAYWDLTIRGEDLDSYDGKKVLVRIGHPDRPPERLGSGEAIIESGAFALVFPAVWEADLYKTKLVLIDVDGDGACDSSVDRLFRDSRAARADVLVVSTSQSGGNTYFSHVDDEPGTNECEWYDEEWPQE